MLICHSFSSDKNNKIALPSKDEKIRGTTFIPAMPALGLRNMEEFGQVYLISSVSPGVIQTR